MSLILNTSIQRNIPATHTPTFCGVAKCSGFTGFSVCSGGYDTDDFT